MSTKTIETNLNLASIVTEAEQAEAAATKVAAAAEVAREEGGPGDE